MSDGRVTVEILLLFSTSSFSLLDLQENGGGMEINWFSAACKVCSLWMALNRMAETNRKDGSDKISHP